MWIDNKHIIKSPKLDGVIVNETGGGGHKSLMTISLIQETWNKGWILMFSEKVSIITVRLIKLDGKWTNESCI